MKIDRLDLIAYGPFTEISLDLSEGSFGLHLIYGDNEAGKSTALRALTAWLFGIPARTGDNFLHSHPRLRIGGKVRLSDGRTLEFVRRKGTKDTLLERDKDAPLKDSILLPFLSGGMDEALFSKLYGIDHRGLVAGGRELLAQTGDLGQALFSAAVGVSNLRGILTELRTGAEELFKPRASTKRVNRAIVNFKEAQKRIRDCTLSVAEWKKLQSDLSDTLALIETVEGAIKEKSRGKSRLDRLVRIQGALAERRVVLARMEELGDVLVLPEDFEEKRRSAADSLRTAGEAKERQRARLSRLQEERKFLNVRGELLENDATIQAIYKELGAVEKVIEDRPKRDSEKRLLRDEAEKLIKSVRPDMDGGDAEQLRPLLNNKKWISDLGRQHSLLIQRKDGCESILREIGEQRQAIESELEETSRSNLQLGGLKAAIAAARKAGDLERRLFDSQKRAFDEKTACDDAFARLGKFGGNLETLPKTAMPLTEILDVFEIRFDDIAEKEKDIARRRKKFEEEREQAAQDLKSLLLKRDIPSIAELEQSRAIRDGGWKLIRRKYIERADVENEVRELVGNSDLPSFYESKVSDADRISDRLRLDADQVVKRAELEAKIENLALRMDEIADETRRFLEEKEVCRNEWAGIWKPLNVDPGTPREMKQWVLKVERLTADVQSAASVSLEAEQLLKECETLRQDLSLQIAAFDESTDLKGMSLEAMIHLCEQRVKQEEAELERKRQLELSLNETEKRLIRTREELKSIEKDCWGWSQEWSRAVDGLGLDAESHPEQAAEAFEKLEMFFEKMDKSEELGKRISGMDQVAGTFLKQVFEFADRIGYNREGLEAGTVAAQLNRDLAEAREARVKLERIESLVNELTEEMENADITIRTGREQLAGLRDLAGVHKDEELQPAGELSRTYRQLREKLDVLEQELIRNGDGLSVAELEKEAEESDIDAVEGDLEKISLELQELHKERDELRDRRQTFRNNIQAKDGSSAAAAASEEAEQQLADLVSGVEQYLRLQIAVLMLQQRIEEYRKRNQAPVLARAGEIFSRLTLGSYAGLRDELDDSGKPLLLGMRPNDEEVSVDGMSDGSRDQLFLALRLATLEQHFGKGEPMPFVVDDILVGFDDSRTAVCLEILAELASKTQVLLFTHHRRVVEIASTLEAKSGIFTHELVRQVG